MGMATIHFSSLHFQYQQTIHPIFDHIDLTFTAGWTAILGANGAGKSTLLQLACGLLKPDFGSVSYPEPITYVEQRTDDPPINYEDFTDSYDRDACRLHGQLEIGRDWFHRWHTLSHGERKRVQIACALYGQPEALAIDEPTNHLDFQTIVLVGDTLTDFDGIGLLVTHDRELSDRLCTSSVIVHAPYVRMFNCKPSLALDESSRISQASMRSLQNGRNKLKALASESTRRKQFASVQDVKRSKRNIAPKDHDAKARIDGARVSGADGKAGRLKAQLDKRVSHVYDSLQDIQIGVEESRKLDLQDPIAGITITGEALKRDMVVAIPAGCLQLGPERYLSFNPLEVLPNDRIAITGANGSGKSTLMEYIHALLLTEGITVAYVPQEQDRATCEKALMDLGKLDATKKGRVISGLHRLGSDPRLIQSSVLASPGEAKKLLFALLFENPISVLLLDEPTNHLDLPARLVLEKALENYHGALVCISHDMAFLRALCTTQWHIQMDERDQAVEILHESAW